MSIIKCPRCDSPPGVMCKTPAGRERLDHVVRVNTEWRQLVGKRCCALCLAYASDTVEIEVGSGPSPLRAVCGSCRDKLRDADQGHMRGSLSA